MIPLALGGAFFPPAATSEPTRSLERPLLPAAVRAAEADGIRHHRRFANAQLTIASTAVYTTSNGVDARTSASRTTHTWHIGTAPTTSIPADAVVRLQPCDKTRVNWIGR